ncbi:hypothetical protein C8R44DRAFT_641926 [Mycena epipterygia]|nr:hypothetical protein C8R44DRAFT_641926 [Mycena epipterygia]
MDVDASVSIVPDRAVAQTADSKAHLTRAEGLWFEDCGLIIQAETTLFRISRDFLATRSPVFQDMLAMPTPQDADMMYGCPFVRMPDSAADITSFLKALLYSEFFESFPVPTTFSVIASVLRMSHKYQVDVLRKRALIHLSSIHPTTLTEWESMDPTSCSWFPKIDAAYLEIILLARQTSAHWILPTAFYRICENAHLDSLLIGRNSLELSPSDKVACVSAIRWLETTGARKVLDFLHNPYAPLNKDCRSPQSCAQRRVKTRLIVECWRDYDPEEDVFFPLDLWAENDWHRVDAVCSPCLTAMKTAHEEAKNAVWNRLPSLFGLPDWTELEKMKAEALK